MKQKANERFDQEFVDYLEKNNFTYVDFLKKVAEEHESFNLDLKNALDGKDGTHMVWV